MEEAYEDQLVVLLCPVHGRSNTSTIIQLQLSIGLYKSGLAIVQNALTSRTLFRDRGDHALLTELVATLDDPELEYGRFLLAAGNVTLFGVPEYCTMFTHLMFNLPESLIDSKTTKELCDIVQMNLTLATKFSNPESLSFLTDDPSPLPEDISTDNTLPFVITPTKKHFLELQFQGSDYQLVELMMYHFNAKLQSVQARDQLVFVLNVLFHTIQRSKDPTDDIEYLSSVFKSLVLTEYDLEIEPILRVVFVVLVFGVGVVVPDIFHSGVRPQLRIPEIENHEYLLGYEGVVEEYEDNYSESYKKLGFDNENEDLFNEVKPTTSKTISNTQPRLEILAGESGDHHSRSASPRFGSEPRSPVKVPPAAAEDTKGQLETPPPRRHPGRTAVPTKIPEFVVSSLEAEIHTQILSVPSKPIDVPPTPKTYTLEPQRPQLDLRFVRSTEEVSVPKSEPVKEFYLDGESGLTEEEESLKMDSENMGSAQGDDIMTNFGSELDLETGITELNEEVEVVLEGEVKQEDKEEDDLAQLLAELELDLVNRIPFRMEKPLLQNLNLPPPQSAVLVRSKYDPVK